MGRERNRTQGRRPGRGHTGSVGRHTLEQRSQTDLAPMDRPGSIIRRSSAEAGRPIRIWAVGLTGSIVQSIFERT
ncbi:MAG TPA: hypothetical protein DDY91_19785 [Planctomycetaceae bacterium]|nr:hypothetical protein [Planctomycetaceae bacterium]